MEQRVEALFEEPLTRLDGQVALVVLALALVSGVFLRTRGDLHGLYAGLVTGAAALLGAWLTHHGRLGGLLGVPRGLWEMAVPALLAGLAGAPLSKRGRSWMALGGWLLWWGATVRLSYFFLSMHRLQ